MSVLEAVEKVVSLVAMVADFSKWKFNQWPFFPEKLSGSEGNGEKIGSF